MMDHPFVELVIAQGVLASEQLELRGRHEGQERAAAPAHRAVAPHDRSLEIQRDLVSNLASATAPLIRPLTHDLHECTTRRAKSRVRAEPGPERFSAGTGLDAPLLL